MTELVSVVIPTYKRDELLGYAIDSVLQQTYQNFEIIVVDDNANEPLFREKTRSVMKKYENDSRIILLENEMNLGGAGSRNTGIKAARGNYIAFLDDDDEFLPERLEKQLLAFETSNQEKLALMFCDAQLTLARDKAITNLKSRYQGRCIYEALVNNCLAATSQWMVKKEALIAIGLFPLVPCKQDSTVILKLLEAGYEVSYIPEVLSKYCNYDVERLSSITPKKLEGELMYEKLCRSMFRFITEEQRKEAHYVICKRIAFLCKELKEKKLFRQYRREAIKIHPVDYCATYFRYKYRRIKMSIMTKGA